MSTEIIHTQDKITEFLEVEVNKKSSQMENILADLARDPKDDINSSPSSQEHLGEHFRGRVLKRFMGPKS